MEIVVKAAQLILSLSILVIFHELGHFTFAKLFKTRVEKFYLFFDPWFSLLKFKKGETEYGIGWVPLGGYVKISGMIDESMDKAAMQLPPQPYEFRSKPAWQRLLIMIGGVLVNFILAVCIYILMLFVWGKEYLPAENAKYGIVCDSLALKMGLQNGDKIIALDNKKVSDFSAILPSMILNSNQTIQVERQGAKIDIAIPKNFISELTSANHLKTKSFFITPAYPFVVEDATAGSPALKAGLKKGDKIVGINDLQLAYFPQYPQILNQYKGKTITLQVERNGAIVKLPCDVNKSGKLGVAVRKPDFKFAKTEYSFLQSIPEGISTGYHGVIDYFKQIKLLFNPETEAYKSMGGFISIGNIFPSVWDWQSFWTLTALLSIMLGVMNILPIPALDGGHVLFLIFEVVTGRKPSDKFMEYAQVGGMVLLFGLLIFANGNDIIKLFTK